MLGVVGLCEQALLPVCVGDGLPPPGSLRPHEAWGHQMKETPRGMELGWAGSRRKGEGGGSILLVRLGEGGCRGDRVDGRGEKPTLPSPLQLVVPLEVQQGGREEVRLGFPPPGSEVHMPFLRPLAKGRFFPPFQAQRGKVLDPQPHSKAHRP